MFRTLILHLAYHYPTSCNFEAVQLRVARRKGAAGRMLTSLRYLISMLGSGSEKAAT